jgi:hypothetical protein
MCSRSLRLHIPTSVNNKINTNMTHPLPSVMTPEAAASLLLSISTQQQQQPRLNLSFPLSNVKLATATNLCCGRDCVRINSMLQSGSMREELMFELGASSTGRSRHILTLLILPLLHSIRWLF